MQRKKKKGPGGGTSKFKREMLRQIELLAKLGAKDTEIAEFFEVDVTTLEQWMRKYPEVKYARRKGGILADLNVVDSLYKRATGYDFTEQQLVNTRNGPKVFKVKKHVIPSEKSIQMWLMNRQRANWANPNQLNVSGTVTHNHIEAQDIPFEDLSKKSQDFLFELGKKQLTNGNRQN